MLILNLPPCFPHRIAEWKSSPNSKQTFIWTPSIRSYIILALGLIFTLVQIERVLFRKWENPFMIFDKDWLYLKSFDHWASKLTHFFAIVIISIYEIKTGTVCSVNNGWVHLVTRQLILRFLTICSLHGKTKTK